LLRSVYIENFRNISESEFQCVEGFNWFVGENGAGKSSVLEALSILLSTKSFRTHKSKTFIAKNSNESLVRGEIQSSLSCETADLHRIAVRKSRDESTSYRFNGNNISAGEFIQVTPAIQVIAPEAASLLDSGSQERRKFIDWGVFHVKHRFLGLWRTYNRLLRQRNAILKDNFFDKIMLKSIDLQWLPVAEDLHRTRYDYWKSMNDFLNESYFSELEEILSDNNAGSRCSIDLSAVEIRYKPGWATGKSLSEALSDNLSSDHRMGFTQVGPHRADFLVLIDGTPAVEVLSRGQKKILQAWLKLKQSQHIYAYLGKNTIFLVDDISAELDPERAAWAYQQMSSVGNQVFGTSIEVDPALKPYVMPRKSMFHVKHGVITPF
jgi:DNA replication and repair protein RecF